jgi:hypothetical protein
MATQADSESIILSISAFGRTTLYTFHKAVTALNVPPPANQTARLTDWKYLAAAATINPTTIAAIPTKPVPISGAGLSQAPWAQSAAKAGVSSNAKDHNGKISSFFTEFPFQGDSLTATGMNLWRVRPCAYPSKEVIGLLQWTHCLRDQQPWVAVRVVEQAYNRRGRQVADLVEMASRL